MTAKMTPEIARTLSAAEQHEWFRSVTSRRSLLRGGLVGVGAVAAGPTLLSGTSIAAPSRASPRRVAAQDGRPRQRGCRPAVRPPRRVRRQAEPADVGVLAASRPGQQPLRPGRPVALGSRPADRRRPSRPDHATHRHRPPSTSVPPSDTGPVVQYYVQAEINGLRPGETYYYSVGHDGWDAPAHPDTIRSFTTAPLVARRSHSPRSATRA